MAIELEQKLEDRSVAKAERVGAEAVKLVILRLMGWPDRTILMPGGHVWFAEFKRQVSGRVSAQQKFWRRRLLELGFRIYIIDNDEDFDRALETESRHAQLPGWLGGAPVRPEQRARTTSRRGR